MLITDAQVHLWAAETASRPWAVGHGKPHREVPFTAEDAIAEMDLAGVDRAVVIPPSWEGDRNDVALRAVGLFPERFRVMGRIDLTSPSPAEVRDWLETPGMLGIRVSHRRLLVDDVADWFWPEAQRAGIPVMIFVPGKTGAIGAVAAAFPELRLIIDHLNLAGGTPGGEIGSGVEELIRLATLPNVAVKISGVPTRIKEQYPFPSLRPILEKVIGAFGAERCMWGSDLTHLPCPYVDWVRGITEAGFLSESEKELIMGGSLSRWLNWPTST